MIKMNLIPKFSLLQILSIRGIRFLDRIRLFEFLGSWGRSMISNQVTFWFLINPEGYVQITRLKI
jgi:hypothetical protein